MRKKDFIRIAAIVSIITMSFIMSSSVLAYSIFGDYISYYSSGPGAQWPNLSTADDLADGFVDYIINDSNNNGYYSQQNTTVFGNSSAWATDYSSNDDTYADNADIVFFTGHGFGGSFVFTTQNNSYVLGSSQMSLGDNNAEWLFAFTCNFTNPIQAHSDTTTFPGSEPFDPDMMNGIHVVCGYKTDMTVTAASGSYCADYLTGYGMVQPSTVRESWRLYGLATQNGSWNNEMRIWYADSCSNDYIWGYGTVASDPQPYSTNPQSYSYVDYKLNWN